MGREIFLFSPYKDIDNKVVNTRRAYAVFNGAGPYGGMFSGGGATPAPATATGAPDDMCARANPTLMTNLDLVCPTATRTRYCLLTHTKCKSKLRSPKDFGVR